MYTGFASPAALGVIQMKPVAWEEAAAKWVEEKQDKADIKGDIAKLKWFEPHFRGRMLHEIDRELVKKVVENKENPATRNRYVALVRAILRAAQREWGMVAFIPAFKTYAEPRRRIRSLTPEQVKALVEALPPFKRDLFLFAIATGLRQGNVTKLEWSWIDLDKRALYVPDTKNDEPLGVPLNDLAMDVLARRRGKHKKYVFAWGKKPVENVSNRHWYAALDKAGIVGFRWHDATRHTWASWLAQSGIEQYKLQEMGGWKSVQMVRRYAHLKTDHLLSSSRTIDDLIRTTD